MATSPTRGNGAYVPLNVYYYQDDRIGEVGPAAELLFVRGIAYCAGKLTDGFMTERQVRLYVGVGLDDVEDLCKRLVGVGLWDRDDDRNGYIIRNFLKYNRSREEIDMSRARDAARKRRERNDDRSPADVQPDSARSPNGVRSTTQLNTTQLKESVRSIGPDRTDSLATHDRSPAAAPPDLGPLREHLSDASRATRARFARRAGGAS